MGPVSGLTETRKRRNRRITIRESEEKKKQSQKLRKPKKNGHVAVRQQNGWKKPERKDQFHHQHQKEKLEKEVTP